jgi:type IX secretion system PorP/SprF family membrane protein
MHFIKKLTIVFVLGIASYHSANAQQNIQFTQYMFNSLSVNPAYAGYKEEWFAQMALRNQWVGLDGAPKTGSVSIDGILNPEKKTMGLGLQITADKLGPQTSTSAYLNYAYRLQLDAEDTKRLSFGLGVGMSNYSLDGSILKAVNNSDTQIPTSHFSNFIPDARVGVYYNTAKYYLGLAVTDLFSGDRSNDFFDWNSVTYQNIKRKRNMYIMMGMLSTFTEEIKLRPSILIKEDFRGPTALDLNTMVILKDRFWLGASYHTGINLKGNTYSQGQNITSVNSVSFVTQFYVTEQLRVGYSYDYTLSGLKEAESGSHEITVGLTLPSKILRIISPRFF